MLHDGYFSALGVLQSDPRVPAALTAALAAAAAGPAGLERGGRGAILHRHKGPVHHPRAAPGHVRRRELADSLHQRRDGRGGVSLVEHYRPLGQPVPPLRRGRRRRGLHRGQVGLRAQGDDLLPSLPCLRGAGPRDVRAGLLLHGLRLQRIPRVDTERVPLPAAQAATAGHAAAEPAAPCSLRVALLRHELGLRRRRPLHRVHGHELCCLGLYADGLHLYDLRCRV